jgi:hypothetical protein
LKRFRLLSLTVLFAFFISILVITPVSAATLEGEVFDLAEENSAYKVIVPNFVELKDMQVDVMGEYMMDLENVIVMAMPAVDANGHYPLFEIVTTDTKAGKVDSYPGTYTGGQVGNFYGNFENGSIIYTASFSLEKDTVYMLNFNVLDKEDNFIHAFEGLYFIFVDQASQPAPIKPVSDRVTALTTSSKVVVDGKEVAFEAYNIDGSNYFKLRDLAMALNESKGQFQVGWDAPNKSISLTKGEAYTADGSELAVSETPHNKIADPSSAKLYVDGNEVSLTAYTIDGNNYFKLRDIAKAIDFGVEWNAELSLIGLDSTTGYTE